MAWRCLRAFGALGGVVLAFAVPGCHPSEGDPPADDDATAGDDDTTAGDDDTSPDEPLLAGDCDPLVPSRCGFPFPSNVWLVSDPSTPSGKRVEFSETTLPMSRSGVRTPPDVFRLSDGFSAGATLLTHLPGATATGLADPEHIAESVEPDSRTVLLDAETGERIPHFAELDMATDQEESRAFMVRPVVRLRDAARYVVAIRGVVDSSGVALEPTPVFRALRDGTDHEDPSVERRRALYEDIFTRLEAAGVGRGDLQLAWDFSTASRENNTAPMLAMRDAALAEYGPEGPPYVVDSVEDDWSEHVARRIEGRIEVPLYLDDPGPGGEMVVDALGMPVRQGTTEYPFVVLIPRSAAQGEPKPILQYGHGLFGDRYSVQAQEYQEMADELGYVLVSMDWIGMSGADVSVIAAVVAGGDATRFRTVPDRSQQGFLGMLVAMRAMMGAFAQDPASQFDAGPSIDPSRRYYFGGSQGGIYGASYMALTTDIERGCLAVPGQPYSLLLPRSILYDEFSLALSVAVEDVLDTHLILGVVQMLWDRAEPNGYSAYIVDDPLPGTPSHEVVLMEAIGDHQVPNLGTEVMARAIGAPHLQPGNRELYGLEPVEAPHPGTAFIDYDFGLPPVPTTNVPMREGEDPHGKVADVLAARLMVDAFFRTGEVQQFCDGPCDPD
ncbi:hypothetical protein L6R50_18190 [Myxococcota bacterium]|nr:hypothetical protein [Myxococcota bacterium]